MSKQEKLVLSLLAISTVMTLGILLVFKSVWCVVGLLPVFYIIFFIPRE